MFCSRRKLLQDASALAGMVATATLVGCDRERREALATTTKAALPTPTGPEPAYMALARSGELEVRERKLFALYEKCTLCPRKCEVNRLAGENDVCRATDKLRAATAAAHFGEEQQLVGRRGSGTIFFSHCNLRCCFCQNWELAHRGDGQDIEHRALANAMLALQARGCHNVNLVTPSHMVPHIVRALRIAIADGLRLPLVYNTGGYDALATIELLDGVVDIYMPDFKFQDGKHAHKYCAEAQDYPEAAAAAIKEMHRQVGVLQMDAEGLATRGVLLRHLVMPDNLAGTDRFVQWVAAELSPDTHVNLMGQYRPEHEAHKYPELSRRLTTEEREQAFAWAVGAGLKKVEPV